MDSLKSIYFRLRTKNITLFFVFSSLLLLFVLGYIDIGSKSGGWVYSIQGKLSWQLVFWALSAALLITTFFSISLRWVFRYQRWLMMIWFLIGLLFTFIIHDKMAAPFSQTIKSAGANSFHDSSRYYSSAGDFLKNYDRVRKRLSQHARANMPGKVLLYYGLRKITENTTGIAYILVVLSALGAFLLSWIATLLGGDAKKAFLAFFFYTFLPGRIYFLPLLNSISPLFILLVFGFLLYAVKNRKFSLLLILGVLLYWIVLYEPLLLVTGLIFILILWPLLSKSNTVKHDLTLIMTLPVLSFAICFGLVQWFFGFNALLTLVQLSQFALLFNIINQRFYWIWLFENPKEFFFHSVGVALSYGILASVYSFFREKYHKMIHFFMLGFIFSLCVTDLMGTIRGEVTRIWIFFGAFACILLGFYFGEKQSSKTTGIVVFFLIMQLVFTVGLVKFVG